MAILCACSGASPTCASGTSCPAGCVSLASDNLNCGACGHACPAGEACSGGVCVESCSVGYSVCEVDGGGYCADLSVDFNNCGSCGQSCSPGAYCSAGQCLVVPAGCPGGQVLCAADGGCVDLRTDPGNCGVCGVACAASQSCLAGNCGPTPCAPGFLLCPNGDGGASCTDVAIDVDNCGQCGSSCGPFSLCSGGGCSCQMGFTSCGAPACVDTESDARNCGACGATCLVCEDCSAASCMAASFLVEVAQLQPGDAGYGSLSEAIGDFDGDGLEDVASIVFSPSSLGGFEQTLVEIYFGDGGGGFPRLLTFGSDAGNEPALLASLDFFGDGRRELAVATLNDDFGGSGLMLLGVDAGEIVQILYQSSDPNAAGFPYYLNETKLAVGDLNGDGRDDVILLNGDAGPDLFYSQANGTVVRGPWFVGSFCAYGLWIGIALGDLDGDGRIDVALTCDDFSVGVWLQQAGGALVENGIFRLPYEDPAQNFPLSILIGGGRLNITTFAGLTSYQWADGGLDLLGTFPCYGATASADMNGDGVQDVVGTAVCLGRDGGFGGPSKSVGALAVGDLNGDGRPDVVAGNAVLLNTCSPSP